ncbi:MAG TPA: ABC transporter permease [Nocardioidaceae bacterium]|nr:ABC transporter permease [Nocardioidaceae bacterium]
MRSPQATELAELLQRGGGTVTALEPGLISVVGLDARRVGDLAFDNSIRVHELANRVAMMDALRYEWVRIRTIRSTCWLTGLTVLFGAGLALIISWGLSFAFTQPDGPREGEIDLFGPMVVSHVSTDGAPFFVPYIVAMIGVFTWGHEYRHGMIRATLTALPSRTHAWLAKYLVVGGWVSLVTLVTMLLSAAIGWLFLQDDGVSFATFDVVRIIAKGVIYTLVLTWIATAFASLLRQQAAALVLMFLWPLAIENIVTLLLFAVPGLDGLQPLARFLPYNAGSQMMRVRDVTGSMFGDPLSPWGASFVFGGVTAVLMAAGFALFKRRDA